MAFFRGQKVVCIIHADVWVGRHEDGSNSSRHLDVPKYRQIYTVLDIAEYLGVTHLQLLELDPYSRYDAGSFRPVRTTDAGMSILNKLLLPKSKKARVRA